MQFLEQVPPICMVRLKRVKEDRDTTFIEKKNSERKKKTLN